MRTIRLPLFLFLVFSLPLIAQEHAALSGTVTDSAGAHLYGATVKLHAADGGESRTATTGRDGGFAFDGLPPGDYGIECSRNGFQTTRVSSVVLHRRDRKSISLELAASSTQATVLTVASRAQGISTDPSGETAVSGDYARYLPLNQRSAQSLLTMMPGITRAPLGDGLPTIQFSANGLRPNTNYFLLDGVSTNPGSISYGNHGGIRGASAGEFLLSLDALQELRIHSSPISPEFSRSPGAQISLTSRSGSNQFHGSAFGYFRNEALSANNWFANAAGLEQSALDYRNFGGTVGGPIAQDRTFFFLSYEGLRADLPETSVFDVPTLAARAAAPTALQPYLNAFPVANGADLGNGAARFTGVSTGNASINPFSARLDHVVNERLKAFARYSYSPSDTSYRGTAYLSPNVLTSSRARNHLVTTGLTWYPTAQATNDLRVNYTRDTREESSTADTFGSAVPLNLATILPEGISPEDALFNVNIIGVGAYSVGDRIRQRQEQINVVDNLTVVNGRHTLRAGMDYRRVFSTIFNPAYSVDLSFNGIEGDDGALNSGVATTAVVARNEPVIYPVFSNFSMYGQDTWRLTERSTFTYGFRWDINPSPDVRKGAPPLALGSDGISINRFDRFYSTRWSNIAPRVGFAYQMDTTPGREMIFRAGIGLFYDLGYGSTASAFDGAPYSAKRILSLPDFPLSLDNLFPPSIPSERPFGQVSVSDPNLNSPKVWQWNMTIERMLGTSQSLSIGYVGTKGRDLLRTETLDSFNSAYDVMRITTNGSRSDYHGMQVQFRRSLRSNLLTQLSYTWAHSLDTSSIDTGSALQGFASVFGAERARSDFDIRHNLTFTGSYLLPSAKGGILNAALKDWWADWSLSARTGLPFDVQTLSAETTDTDGTTREDLPGLYAFVRANYLGLPIWISDPLAPGGKRLNPDAFAIPESLEQGDLGRNAINGFGAWQLDLALRRQLRLNESLALQFQAQAINLFNHPAFSNPFFGQSANLASPSFGYVRNTLGQSSGGGANSLYGQGGPRTLQFGIRLEF